MSGTSLDGVDLAHVRFFRFEDSWCFSLIKAVTIPYPPNILPRLQELAFSDDEILSQLDDELAKFYARIILNHFDLSIIDFISSHGHTAKHNPAEGYTLQLGSGSLLYELTGIPVVNDFRSMDVSLGGQGAPLVPIGDRDLFKEFDYTLNLGGIANISFDQDGQRLAYDICPFNMALNEVSLNLGKAYDEGGQIAKSGEVDIELLKYLNEIDYYFKSYPKSLGYEDYKSVWRPVLTANKSSEANKLRTLVEHFCLNIAEACGGFSSKGKLIITGGGAHNLFFLERLESKLPFLDITLPSVDVIDFKEAIIFGYLGLLRVLGLPNSLASVTGASRDSRGGIMHGLII